MGFKSSARVLAAGAAWRVAGPEWAGRTLVHAFSHGDDDARTIAGMSLVRAGDRSLPLLEDAVEVEPDPADLIEVIASLGTDRAEAALERLIESDAPAVAEAAASALGTLHEIRRRNA